MPQDTFPVRKPPPLRRSAYAQAMMNANAGGFYVPDVELVWYDRVDISNGCRPETALLFAYETH